MSKVKVEPPLDSDLEIIIRRVRDLEFFVKEELFKPDIHQIGFNIMHTIGFNHELGHVNLKINVLYSYPEAPQEIVMYIMVENIFEIKDLKKYIPSGPVVKRNEIKLPGEVLVKISDMAISHTRALLSRNKVGGAFADINLPYIDAKVAAKQMFGDLIK